MLLALLPAKRLNVPFGRAISVHAGSIPESLMMFIRAAVGRVDFLRISARKYLCSDMRVSFGQSGGWSQFQDNQHP